MALPSIPAALDADYLAAVTAALSAICWQHEHTSEPNPQMVHEYRGADAGVSAYRVTDVDADPGADWWPVAVVTTSGAISSPGRSDLDVSSVVERIAARNRLGVEETVEMLDGFMAGLRRTEGGAA